MTLQSIQMPSVPSVRPPIRSTHFPTMSLRGRYMIDRVKAAVAHRFKLPCPPYGMPTYWEGVYQKLGPDDVYEWGSTSLKDVMNYKYDASVYADEVQKFGFDQTEALKSPQSDAEGGDGQLMVETTFGETIGVPPEGNAERKSKVLLLGCGNSKFGEDMLTIPGGWYSQEEGGNGQPRTTIIQADVSQRVVSTMSNRCAPFVANGSMELVQDDATSLTAFEDGTVDAVVDKGMMDALFCASRPDILMQVMKSVNRVLIPGGIYGFFSFSRPEFLLKQLLVPIDGKDDEPEDVLLGLKKRRGRKYMVNANKIMWKDVQVRALENILFYRFEKADGEVDDIDTSSDDYSAKIARQKRQRMQRRKQ